MPVELIRLNPYASGINNAKSLCQSLRIDAFDIANAMTVYIVYTLLLSLYYVELL